MSTQLATSCDQTAAIRRAAAADQRLRDAASDLLAALRRAESFIAGFEGDPSQVGLDGLLVEVRSAIAKAGDRP